MWILTDNGETAVNLDHIETLTIVQQDKEWKVRGQDRYASYFWFGPFPTKTKANEFLRTVTAAANSAPRPRPDFRGEK